jgi:glutamate/tyrosine decarboxylase-like PLP-dependent enzyme
MADYYPYADKYPVNRNMPENGRPREEILAELKEIAMAEDGFWQTGQCSGTMYCGDMDHYAFMSQASGLYAHVNILQRDICPSATRFEGEIIAMTLDMLHGDQAEDACGSTTSGGSESILSAVLAYREWGLAHKGIEKPEMILPETAHVAFRKAAHLFGFQVHLAPVDSETTQVDIDFVRDHIGPNTVMIVGSACNYGYGTIDAIDELSKLAVEHEIGLHVDACLGGFILPWGEQLGYDIAVFDFHYPESQPSLPTVINMDMARRAPRFWRSATRSFAAGSTSCNRSGREENTSPRESPEVDPAASSPPPGHRWSAWGAKDTFATPKLYSVPPSRCRT